MYYGQNAIFNAILDSCKTLNEQMGSEHIEGVGYRHPEIIDKDVKSGSTWNANLICGGLDKQAKQTDSKLRASYHEWAKRHCEKRGKVARQGSKSGECDQQDYLKS